MEDFGVTCIHTVQGPRIPYMSSRSWRYLCFRQEPPHRFDELPCPFSFADADDESSRTPFKATLTREPCPSESSAPQAISSASMSRQGIPACTGSARECPLKKGLTVLSVHISSLIGIISSSSVYAAPQLQNVSTRHALCLPRRFRKASHLKSCTSNSFFKRASCGDRDELRAARR